MSEYQKVVAIDGPSGSGKSTVAKKLAQKWGYLYVDTGAMFRALGFYCYQQKIAFEDGPKLKHFLDQLDFTYGKSVDVLVEINGINLTDKIRAHEVSNLASKISKLPVVRHYLLEFQRSLAQDHFCVMEGRDIGTVVFPQAFCKIFLHASAQVRAKRRLNQLMEKGEKGFTFETILEDIKERDQRDSSRDLAPLAQAHDAISLDSEHLSIDQVIHQISDHMSKRLVETGLKGS